MRSRIWRHIFEQTYVCQEETLVSSKEETREETGRSGEERSFSGRFPVRVPRYLHRYLTDVAREQGVSLNQFVCTAAVRAAEAAAGAGNPARPQASDRVSREEYSRIWRDVWG